MAAPVNIPPAMTMPVAAVVALVDHGAIWGDVGRASGDVSRLRRRRWASTTNQKAKAE